MSYAEDRLKEIAAESARMHADNQSLIYKHVEVGKTRHGKPVYYYRKGKGKRTRLPDKGRVTEAQFRTAYCAAANGQPVKVAKRHAVSDSYGKAGTPGFVYFVRSGNTVKIGFTKAIKQRIASLQVSSAENLEVLMVMPATDETERFLHERFAGNRIGGEWFSLVGALAEFIGYSDRTKRAAGVKVMEVE